MAIISVQMPTKVEEDESVKSPTFGRFILQPLEKGFGVTVGNAFRRVILSSLPGQAFTSIRIEGIQHEFSSLPGVAEDVSELILNFKQVRMKLNDKKLSRIELNFKGKREVNAADIAEEYPDLEILNPELHIASLTASAAHLSVELTIGRGRGYVPSDEQKILDAPVGTITMDSIYTPIKNVHYTIEATRVGQQTDFEKLLLEIETDGSITPEESLITAGKILRDHIQLFITLSGEKEPEIVTVEELSEHTRIKKILTTAIDEIELSVRSRNCLQAANIRTIGELVSRDEGELLNVRNFGRKSLSELSDIVAGFGLSFGMDVEKYLHETKE
jgi:DNA-directed RNA polymerase subunit alpha